MTMKNPCHPGEIVLHECVEALGLTLGETAAHLKVAEHDLAALCEGRAPITADMAIRLEFAFGSTADHWLAMQSAHNLAAARSSVPEIAPLEEADLVADSPTDEGLLAVIRRLEKILEARSPIASDLRDSALSLQPYADWAVSSGGPGKTGASQVTAAY